MSALDTYKSYSFVTKKDDCVEMEHYIVHVSEFFTSEGQAVFTWPSALVLAAYFSSVPSSCRGLRCLELGAGTGVPSIVAARMGASSVIATERSDTSILANLSNNFVVNGIESSIYVVKALDWGFISQEAHLHCDLILGADVFYSGEDFDAIMATAATLFCMNPDAVMLTTYQERSSKRTLAPHLDRYGFQASVIDQSTFLHAAHEFGEIEIIDERNSATKQHEAHQDEEFRRTRAAKLPVFDNIYLLQIKLKEPRI